MSSEEDKSKRLKRFSLRDEHDRPPEKKNANKHHLEPYTRRVRNITRLVPENILDQLDEDSE